MYSEQNFNEFSNIDAWFIQMDNSGSARLLDKLIYWFSGNEAESVSRTSEIMQLDSEVVRY